jgi:hypothetical protein
MICLQLLLFCPMSVNHKQTRGSIKQWEQINEGFLYAYYFIRLRLFLVVILISLIGGLLVCDVGRRRSKTT